MSRIAKRCRFGARRRNASRVREVKRQATIRKTVTPRSVAVSFHLRDVEVSSRSRVMPAAASLKRMRRLCENVTRYRSVSYRSFRSRSWTRPRERVAFQTWFRPATFSTLEPCTTLLRRGPVFLSVLFWRSILPPVHFFGNSYVLPQLSLVSLFPHDVRPKETRPILELLSFAKFIQSGIITFNNVVVWFRSMKQLCKFYSIWTTFGDLRRFHLVNWCLIIKWKWAESGEYGVG